MRRAALRQVAPVVETTVLDAYISGLAPSGRRGITSLLNRSAGILKRGADAASYPWEQLSFAAVAKVRAALLDDGYAVSSVNMALSALRGIAQTAFNINCLEADTLARIRAVNGGEYRFTYDETGHPLSETRPDDTSRQMMWDRRGFLSELQENGRPAVDGGIARRLQTFSYDESGVLTGRTTRHAEYRYDHDLNGQLTRIRRTPTAEGVALGTEGDEIIFTRDAAGRLVSESGVNGELSYTWDALGNLTNLGLPGWQQISWLHYGSGHVSAIRFGSQLVTEFTRDRLHREVTRTQGARAQSRSYDCLGRRTAQRSALITEVALPEQAILARLYRYTGRGELAGVSDTLRGEINYGYDAEGRLLKHYEASKGHSSVHFSYDAADNLAASDDPVTDNRLQHWQNLFMQYDAWGNLTRRRSGLYEQHYTYDAENRLVSARGTGPQGHFEAHYRYDALGRRTRKAVTTGHGTTETRFFWQGYRLLQEQHDDGQCSTYIYDPNEAWSPLARVDHLQDYTDGEIYWFSTDLNGAPLEVTDENGSIRWSGQYGSFGEVRYQTDGFTRVAKNTALAHQPLRYAGQYADSETGLHYNLFRYYDPQIGRFIVQDPIGLSGGWNLYQYAPNPLGWVDPWGLAGVDLSGNDLSGRPLSSPNYSVWYQTNIPEDLHGASRRVHFQNANEQLYNALKEHPELGSKLPPEVVSHVQPGARGAFNDTSPPEHTWHHNAQDPSKIELVPRPQHKAGGPVQQSLHPNGQGGFKKLQSGANCS